LKKLFWLIPLVLLTLLAFGCGGNGTPTAVQPAPTQTTGGGATEVAPRTSSVTIPATPTAAGNPAPQTTSVSVLTQKNTVAVGESFEVVVVVDILDKMSRGVECGFAWTPAGLVEGVDVADGDFFKEFTTVHMGASGLKAMHNDTGTVDVLAQVCTSEPFDAGAKGKGVLFIYYFKALQKGEVTFSVPKDSLSIGDVTGDASIKVQTFNAATIVIQ
jgi:hypothetical protein